MKKRIYNDYQPVRQEGDNKKIILPGYPIYPNREDIYNHGKEEEEIDPEQLIINLENKAR